MAFFKEAKTSSVFPHGFIFYQWSILFLLVVASIPNISAVSPVASLRHDAGLNSSEDAESMALYDEGSGYGSLLDILDTSYDDDGTDDASDEDIYDDGGGGGDGGAEIGPVPELNADNLHDSIVLCFRCLGDGTKGCDVEAMLANVESHTTPCIGKCLNLTSDGTSVYDCAGDMASRTDTCLQNGFIKMCFCSGHLCNGPTQPPQRFLPAKTPFTFNKGLTLGGERESTEDSTIFDNETKHPGDTTSASSEEVSDLPKGYNSIFDEDDDRQNGSYSLWDTDQSRTAGADNGSRSIEHELSLSRPKDEGDKKSSIVKETEIDVIIPARFDTDNSTTKETSSFEPIDITELRVGNLQNSVSDSGNRANFLVARSSLLFLSMFLAKQLL